MLKTLPRLTNDDFWRVSADTKTCGSGLNACHLYGGLYYTKYLTKVNKKSAFWALSEHPPKARASVECNAHGLFICD
jgi:hypothetical protein